MQKLMQLLSFAVFFLCSAILVLLIFGYSRIPNEITMQEYETMASSETFVCQSLREQSVNASFSEGMGYETSVKLFNIFPIKSTRVQVSERRYVVPGGNIFGIRLYTQGVMIVKIDDVETDTGKVNPGSQAGLRVGDMILRVNGREIADNSVLSKAISASNGSPLTLEIQRAESAALTVTFTPALSSSDGTYKGGLWIRDSTAGIGTMTYYDRATGTFAGLGHAVCDVDTGEIMPLSGGDAVEAVVKGCYKGAGGEPGELCGVFGSSAIGTLLINGDTGIFGTLHQYDRTRRLLPVALPSEVRTGPAQMISTVDGDASRSYAVEITRVYRNAADRRNLVIKVTDPALIEKTGGIVQGMSGSPILQNGMLVGAVTHVFIDNAEEGYGIFAQTMLETQDALEQSLVNQNAG